MSDTPGEVYDQVLKELIQETVTHDIHSEEFREASKNLRLFSESRSLMPQPDQTPEVEPEREMTRWQKIRAEIAAALDNETTRTIIKAGGAFAGVAVVAYSTIHRDHVIERQALAQANQRPS
jgi:hypothetical protein